MNIQKEFDEMLDKLETGAFVYAELSSKMLEFNEYMALRGYSVAQLELCGSGAKGQGVPSSSISWPIGAQAMRNNGRPFSIRSDQLQI